MTRSRYLQIGGAATLATVLWAAQAATPAAAPSPAMPRAKLMINVRALPDLDSPIVAVLNPGDAVSVSAEQGEFVRLRTAAGTEGYLKHKYLQDYRPPAPPPPAARSRRRSRRRPPPPPPAARRRGA